MSVPITRIIRTNDDGTKDQVFPQTHVNAIFGLKEALDSKEISVGVKSINGYTGDVKIEVLTEEDFQRIMRVVREYESGNLNSFDKEEFQTVVKEFETRILELEKAIDELKSKE